VEKRVGSQRFKRLHGRGECDIAGEDDWLEVEVFGTHTQDDGLAEIPLEVERGTRSDGHDETWRAIV
jgi:hypothetical protein